MEYREIVSVTGMGGLYQLLATKSDGAIVKNLADQSTKFISARLHNVTPLESIEIYTIAENVRLHEVLQQMKDSSDTMPNAKNASNDEIKGYFKKVYPGMDEERVYVSDMKKMLKWFDILKANDLLNFENYNKAAEEAEATVEEVKSDEKPSSDEDEKPVKKAATKKAAKKEGDVEGEEKPAKKTAAKKAAKKEEGTEDEEKPAKKTAKKKAE
jgi:Tfp pilus assembly protein PilN